MSQDWVAFVVFAATFACGFLGLFLQRWPPERHMSDDTRDLINRVTGLVGTMTALVLGLLIASAHSFYNSQKDGLELTAARLVQLDGVLRRYGPEAARVRDQLKAGAITMYDQDWGSGSETVPTITESTATIDAFAASLDSLQPTTPAQTFRLSRAQELAAAMADQRLQMTLQLTNSLSWPFLTILLSWTSLLFFGFGLTVRQNATAVGTLAVGAFAVASAVFLIVELSQPYSGLLRLPPGALLQAIGALGN